MKRLFCLLFVFALCACDDGSDNATALLSFEDSPGAFGMGRRTDVLLQDDARDRTVRATFWYPADGDNQGALAAEEGASLRESEARYPLIVLVHKISDNAHGTWNYLGPYIASHGYVVMAPSTGSSATTGADIINHPGDISFLIDTALGLNDAVRT